MTTYWLRVYEGRIYHDTQVLASDTQDAIGKAAAMYADIEEEHGGTHAVLLIDTHAEVSRVVKRLGY